jgi:hypothetical protein
MNQGEARLAYFGHLLIEIGVDSSSMPFAPRRTGTPS